MQKVTIGVSRQALEKLERLAARRAGSLIALIANQIEKF